MRWTVLAAAAAALAFTTTSAQAQSIQHFTRADFERALVDAGATITTKDPKAERIDFEFDGGVIADALLLACEDNIAKIKCLGSSMLATFEPEDRTREQIIEAINTYNYKENFGRAYLDQDGTISVRMYIIADGGITRANYSSQIGLWFASVSDFFGYLYGEE